MAQSRDELNAKSRARMAAYRCTPEYQAWLIASRENRKRLKAKYRREKGIPTREEKAAAAHQKRKAKELAKADAHVQLHKTLMASLHQSHVAKYQKAMKSRQISKRQYYQNPNQGKARASKRRSTLSDSYVRQNIAAMGVPSSAITPELIELKREAMQFRRLSLQAKTILTNYHKENHEALTEHA